MVRNGACTHCWEVAHLHHFHPSALPDGMARGMCLLSATSRRASSLARSWLLMCTQAHPKEKLPALFLLDSIVKNAGGPFVAIFARNLSQVRNV